MFSQAIGVFRVKVVKATLWLQLSHAQRLVTQHCYRQLAAFDERFC